MDGWLGFLVHSFFAAFRSVKNCWRYSQVALLDELVNLVLVHSRVIALDNLAVGWQELDLEPPWGALGEVLDLPLPLLLVDELATVLLLIVKLVDQLMKLQRARSLHLEDVADRSCKTAERLLLLPAELRVDGPLGLRFALSHLVLDLLDEFKSLQA